MGSASKETPMMRQYLSIKEQYRDAILFFRMGDFYEMFLEDAEQASQILEIALTSRNKKDETPVPMCGVPVRAAQGYIAKLIEHGRKVAVCEQVEDAAEAKGIVRREVVRLVTPGMIVEHELLDAKSNNFILALAKHKNVYGMAWVDISTGVFQLAELQGDSLADEVLRISPSELLISESMQKTPLLASVIKALPTIPVTCLEPRYFYYQEARDSLLAQFKTVSLEGFGCEQLPVGVGAAGALLNYIRDTQKQEIAHISAIETCHFSQYLLLDDLSCRNLELIENAQTKSRKGSLLGVLDQTMTAMGARLLKRWLRYPLKDINRIHRRLSAVSAAKHNLPLSRSIRQELKSVYDIERLASKIVMGYANARDLLALKRSLTSLPGIVSALSQFPAELYAWPANLDALSQLAEMIHDAICEDAPPAINEGGIIREGYHAELDDLIRISRDGKGELLKLEKQERLATRIHTLKVRYNKVFGYYIEIPKAQAGKTPDHYIRKQTLANAERYMTQELKQFEEKVLNAEERRATLELQIFSQLKNAVIQQVEALRKLAEFIANIDCLLTLAEVAELNAYNLPEIADNNKLLIEDGRHPVVEKMIAAERFVPNSIRMDNEQQQIMIITGPNMAGKSTVLRQTAILVVMAHIGSFVPAKKAEICLTDRIFTRVGALDNLSQGQSTFMVEMQETANILHHATPNSLVIMDEIGRGTSTFDGLSIAWAVAEYLHDLKGRGVKTLFATHYHELTALSDLLPRVKNYNIAVKEFKDDIIFLRKLVEGGTNRSYGIQVARLAGIPEKVILRAKKVLADIEAGKAAPPEHNPLLLREPEKGYIQMDLFDNPSRALLAKLQHLDLSKMTPLDAMNLLHDMQSALKLMNIN